VAYVVSPRKIFDVPTVLCLICSDGFVFTNGSYLSVLYFIAVTVIGTYIILIVWIFITLETFAGYCHSAWAHIRTARIQLGYCRDHNLRAPCCLVSINGPSAPLSPWQASSSWRT